MRAFVVGLGGIVGVVSVALVSCADDPTSQDTADASAVEAATEAGGDATIADGARDLDATDAGSDVVVPLVDTCGDAGVISGAWVADPHLCLTVFADNTTLTLPRQMAFAPNGDLFVVSYGVILALFDLNKDGFVVPSESSTYTVADGATHGIAFSPDGAFVYASSESTIFRWAYKPGDRVAPAPAEIVVRDMPSGGHTSRTLVFDTLGKLYVNVGSEGDVDIDPQLNATRAMVRRFTIPNIVPSGGIAYDAGEVFASGLRNEVGLAFDSKGRMWGVENGSDGTYQPVPYDDNPAEKLNRLDAPGSRFYGYPHCWTEFMFAGGLGPGTQWAYVKPNPQTDAWCRDPKNVQPTVAAMQGHWAPLGVTEISGGSLPWKGDLLVASHGSSGRVPPVGRLLARAHLVGDKVVSMTPIVGHLVDGGLEQGTWDARPVDVRMGPDGALYFSDDSGVRILRLGYRP